MAVEKSEIFTFDINTDYNLNARITRQDQPMFGIDMTCSLTVLYNLIDLKTSKKIFEKEFTSSGTATMSDSFGAPQRVNMANERAAKKNIELAMKAISKLNL